MKKVWMVFLVVAALCASTWPAVADEIGDLKAQVLQMQNQMQALMARIQTLETEKAQPPSAVRDSFPSEGEPDRILVERVSELEKQLAQSRPEGMPSILGGLEIHGKVELTYVDAEQDTETEEPYGHLFLDKIRLSPEYQISEDIRFEADLDFGEDSNVEADEYYFEIENLPLDSELRIGKDDRFFKPEVYTNRYPALVTAFSRDEVLGFHWKTPLDPFYLRFAWTQGLELKRKELGEVKADDKYSILHDDNRDSGYRGFQEVSGGIGFKENLGPAGEVDVMVFALRDRLTADDVSELNSRLNSYSSNDRHKVRTGLNFDYTWQDFNLFLQLIKARDGEFDRRGFFVQPSFFFELPVDWKYGRRHQALFRYGYMDVDADKTFNRPATWDRNEQTLALISEIAGGLKLRTEYTRDGENNGVGTVDNNEFMMQLLWEW